MADVDEYFPRGGKKPTTTHFKQNANFLGTIEKKEKKRKPKKKAEEDDGYLSEDLAKESDKSYKTCGLWISYKVIKPDFLVLGRVFDIKDTKIIISLPSRLIGSVMACHISEPYNKLLEAYVDDKIDKVPELGQMFKRGQYVAVKVLEVLEKSIMLTMMPQHVNSDRKHSDLHKGALLQVAVSSIEDHGFIVDTGIPNTTAFLPKKAVNPDLELAEGAIIWCTVKSVKPSTANTVLTLSNDTTSLQNAFQKTTSTTIPPGTCLEFVVDKPLDNGIEGRIFGDRTAYIQRHHINTTKGKKPMLGQKIRARLIYTLSASNIPFLTMRDIFDPACLDMETEQIYNEGDIIEEAQVLKILGRAVYFKLSPNQSGVLSIRRIQNLDDLTDEEVLLKSYPIGSTHKVRILGYHLLDGVYYITDQVELLRERYFTLHQLAVAELVTATITTVNDTFLRANVGRVNAFIPHAHMTDAGIFVDPKKASTSKLPKKKFKVGQEVKARVLSIDESHNNVVLTLKPTLLSPELEILERYEDAVPGKAYTGVVSQIREHLLVSFFGSVKAFVPRKFVSREPLDSLTHAFHLGQIVKCVLINVSTEEKKLVGSLITEPFDGTMRRPKRQHNDSTIQENLKEDQINVTDEVAPKKRKKNKENCDANNMDVDNEVQDDAITEKKKDKKNDKKKKKEEQEKAEESDAIETDIQEAKHQTLSPGDLKLLDLSNCRTEKDFTQRVRELLRVMNIKMKKLTTAESKIQDIENKGLNPTNKKYHTELHIERLVHQENIQKFLDTVKIAQEKLKEFGSVSNKVVNEKAVSDKVKAKEVKVKEVKVKEVKVEDVKASNQEKIDKIKDIKVVDKLEPVLEAPSAKDFWSADAPAADKTQQDESSSSEEEEQEKPKKKRKKLSAAEKAAKAREEEERVREMERRAIESESQPRSVEQFQRALLASPDCSQLWIAYMAFHLQATEIERARGVARKALATINFREEQERLNVHLALLNLEHRFGTKESQQQTLDEALQTNDRYKVHSALLDILVDTSKPQELVQLVELMLRKYRQLQGVYGDCGAACYKAGLVDKARYVMQKGVAALEKKQHVQLLVRFAQLERSLGSRERSEALFEQVLGAYPARVDVAAVYVDALLKTGDVEHVRQVLERLTSHKLPARKMKVLFKKWIEVEEKYGNKDQVEQIRQRAAEYVEKAKF
ncbi:protein RRP5 homolog [Zerene cesonia]|uniref:protein RRP5 homolog n=1 Tax=Zerene cesonia TaxID=33412 RepID=UPI0018E576B0|nr:protein RRP5 homolog [Zerene cesonia]